MRRSTSIEIDEENPSLHSTTSEFEPLQISSSDKPELNFILSRLYVLICSLQEISIDSNNTKLLSGADTVLIGTVPASKVVRICGKKPPQYLWFVLSGGGCDVVQFFIDYTIHKGFKIENATICWTLGFFFSILVRHTSHRYLVFGDYVGGYKKSLIRMYGGYSFSIIASMIFNWIMTTKLETPHYVAWVFTLLWTGGFNYFMLKKLWSFTGK